MGFEEVRGRLAGVISSPIMDEKQVFPGVSHDHLHKCLVTVGVESALDALIKQTPRAMVNSPVHLGAFARATGGHLGLPATPRPGITSGAPLRKADFIFEEDHAFTTLGSTQNRRPFVPQPGLTAGFIEMV